MDRYLKFVAWAVAFGAKLPAILKALEALAVAFSGALPTVPNGEDSLQLVVDDSAMTSLTDDDRERVMRAESQIAEIVAGPEAAWDGSRLRSLFKFLKDSGLLDVLLSKVVPS